MKTYSILIGLLLFSVSCFAQTITQKIDKAVKQLQADPQMKHATMSLYVVETKTGKPVYALNEQVGLAPASTQKIFTSVAAFELLGKDFRYFTNIGYQGTIADDSLNGFICIKSNGDPTFGSNRFSSTKPDFIFNSISNAFRKAGIKKLNDVFKLSMGIFDEQSIPDGWIWQDIGNYYGAGVSQINWKENLYQIKLKSGNSLNENVKIIPGEADSILNYKFTKWVTSAPKESGDQTYIYLPLKDKNHLIEGTIPVNENNFIIKGATKNPQDYFINEFRAYLNKENFLNGNINNSYHLEDMEIDAFGSIYTHSSPTIDSINYWFLQKSINLYGEALLRTMGEKVTMFNSTKSGVAVLKDFWSKTALKNLP